MKQPVELPVIPTDTLGLVDLEALTQAMDSQVRLVCLTHVAGQIGLSTAADYALDLGLENIAQRVRTLAKKLVAKLGLVKDVTVHERSDELSGIVTFNVANKSATEIQQKLSGIGINISVSTTANARLDFGRRGLNDVARALLHSQH